MSVKCLSAILGPEMGASILWTPVKMRSFCRGGVFWVLGGGGGVTILFLWARGFFLIFFVHSRKRFCGRVRGSDLAVPKN